VLVTIVVSWVGIVFSLPIGILLALGRRSNMPAVKAVLGDLHRVRARRAADHRAVHGERDAAAVRAGCLFAGQAAARAGRHRDVRSAYMAEVVRAGLQAIPKGQYEGAMAVGLGYWQMMYLIILPQALKVTIPNIVNTYIGLSRTRRWS
jgi:general L-amino acid transport system permease protein